ncbi:MAG TPA: outer membrane lipoprotein-sorting protein [Firmicutes bacterium]|jgi:outer membrane lipoprotein-sorting protein|nr:outer membrane lipoprotein-sorting protein [Bacillota bacterium]
MKTVRFFAAAVLILIAASVTVQADDFSQIRAILERIDAQSRFSDTDFSCLATLIVEDPEKGIEKMAVRQFRRDDGERYLLLIQEPVTQRGQGYLLEGDNLWFYDPSSRQFAHTSLKETFQDSDARNADFGSSSYATSYDIEGYFEGTLGNFEVYIIELKAVDDSVPFPYITLWVTKDTNLVLKAEEYSLTRRLMRSSLFTKYAKVGEAIIPVQMVFVDELVEGKKTQVSLSEISVAPIPDHVFTKAYLERVNR